MSHEITIRADGQAEFFAGSDTPAWHQLGTVIPGLATVGEVLPLSKTDWSVEVVETYCKNESDEGFALVPNAYAILRTDNRKVLGVCKGRYTPIQNQETVEFAEALVGTGLSLFDAGGSLKGGKKVFYTLKVDGKFFVREGDGTTKYKYPFKIDRLLPNGTFIFPLPDNGFGCSQTREINGVVNLSFKIFFSTCKAITSSGRQSSW